MADLHLQVRPGTDAFLLAAILAVLVREGSEDRAFLDQRTTGFAAVRVDLGLQQSLHSTLNSYLEKLLFLLPGHSGRPGCNCLHTGLLPMVGHSEESEPAGSGWRTAATGLAEIGKLFPPNVLPAEIESDRSDRIRGLVVDRANPVVSSADTQVIAPPSRSSSCWRCWRPSRACGASRSPPEERSSRSSSSRVNGDPGTQTRSSATTCGAGSTPTARSASARRTRGATV